MDVTLIKKKYRRNARFYETASPADSEIIGSFVPPYWAPPVHHTTNKGRE
jgi:hypothetical protein